MNERSSRPRDWKELRERVIGLGSKSMHKSYYPVLQKRLRELQASEARFHAVYDSVNDAILVHDPSTLAIVDANSAACKLYGYGCEELATMNLGDLSSGDPPYTAKSALRLITRATECEPQPVEWLSRNRDGRLFWAELSLKQVRVGEQTLVLSVAQDITEQKLAREALERSERRYKDLVELIPAGIVVHSDERVLYVNPASVQAAKAGSADDFIGRPIWDFIAPQWREMYKERYRKLLSGEAKSALLMEGQLLDINGVAVDVEGASIAITFDGKDAILSTFRDVTDRKRAMEALRRSEQRLSLVLDATTEGIYDFNIPTGEVFFSPNWLHNLGYSLGELAPHVSSWEALVHPDDLGCVKDSLEDHLQGKIPVYLMEYRLRNKNGSYRWYMDRGQVVERDLHGKPLRMVGAVLDISDRKAYEEALEESERRYRLLFENMIAGIALHEMIYDEHGTPVDYKFIEANPAFEKLTGIPIASLPGKTVREVIPTLERFWIDAYASVVETGRPAAYRQYSRSVGKYFDIWAFSPGPGKFATVFTDVTERVRGEREKRALELHKRKFYRETILSVTDGKLEIGSAADVRPYIAKAQACMDVTTPDDLYQARCMVENVLKESGLDEDTVGAFMIAVGEAITNAIKHAPWGRTCVGENGEEVWVTIADNGHGIDAIILPGAVLRRGFSTRKSLGLGYSIMLDAADHMLLKTDNRGTTLVLFKRLHPMIPSLESIPDTWESMGL